MRKYNSILFAICLMAGISSCEMRDEMFGNLGGGKDSGVLELDLSSVYKTVSVSRGDVVDGGIINGDFNEEDVNVDNYTLIVKNTDTQEEVVNGNVAELKNNDGNIVLPLAEGSYSVTAYNYDGENVTVSERPYFKGEQVFSIKKGISTSVDLLCKLSCIEVSLGLAESFKESFNDDYAVTIDNGDGASQIFDNSNLGKKFYFKVPENKNSLNVSVKATSKENNFIEMTAVVQKPADAEGGIANLAAGDSFEINLTEEGATDSYISIGITVDLTFTEKGETIEIPVENITYDGPEVPNPGEEGGEEPAEPITFEGLPAEYTCKYGDTEIAGLQDVRIIAPNGIKNLNVTISGEIASLLSVVGLPETFDICDMDDDLKGKIVGLGLVTEEEYVELHAGTCTDFTFRLGGLLVLIPQVVQSGTSTFNLTVFDGINTKDGDITVVVNP